MMLSIDKVTTYQCPVLERIAITTGEQGLRKLIQYIFMSPFAADAAINSVTVRSSLIYYTAEC